MQQATEISKIKNVNKNFVLKPRNFNRAEYLERVDRNVGWITKSEQKILRSMTVGIAGCGGMGGLLGSILVRLGIGHIKLADLESFDASNINRQFGAQKNSIGQSKALVTAQMLRNIADDTHIYVYPRGISADSIHSFTQGCDIICDEIEFWAIGSRLLLHHAIDKGTVIFNGNSVGMGTRVFRFTNTSPYKMRDLLKIDVGQALEIQNRIQNETATAAERKMVMETVIKGLVPRIPEYCAMNQDFLNKDEVQKRLIIESKAPIIATNPPMAAGFLANQILMDILRRFSTIDRVFVYPPDMPGYIYFDTALLKAEVVRGIWWD